MLTGRPGQLAVANYKKTYIFSKKLLTFPLIYDIILMEKRKGDPTMLKKNKEKEERKNRPLWNGYYTRKTPTKKERIERAERKHKSLEY